MNTTTTTTYQIVTRNSVYDVVNHSYSDGVSVRALTSDAKLGGEWVFFKSVRFRYEGNDVVMFADGGEHGLEMTSSAVQSIVRIDSSVDGASHKPVNRTLWLNIKLVGHPLPSARQYTTV